MKYNQSTYFESSELKYDLNREDVRFEEIKNDDQCGEAPVFVISPFLQINFIEGFDISLWLKATFNAFSKFMNFYSFAVCYCNTSNNNVLGAVHLPI